MAECKAKSQLIALIAKRVCDMVVSAFGLIILAPFIVPIGLLIKLDSRGPVLFRQVRTGLGGRPFTMYKFRTMVTDAEKGGLTVLQSDPRVTCLGHWLRSFSIDELLQFFNVLKGEMSLVGPRPLLPEQTERFTAWERKRLQVLPGMTSLALLKGRNNLSWQDRMKWDIWYVDHRSLQLDIQILLKSVWVVLQRRGVYAANEQEVHNEIN